MVPLKIVYVRYSDPMPFSEDPGKRLDSRFHRMIFSAAGLLIREDEETLFLGERAVIEDNGKVAERYGRDMFPAYRNILPIRKEDILERKDVEI